MKGSCALSTRYEPPTHFLFKIESFSKLTSSSLERYESCVFHASGSKWKLVVYPNGNKTNGAEDHISLYLVPADDQSNVSSVTFGLFVFDHIGKKYSYAQGASGNYTHKSNLGFDKFLTLKAFIDPSNGYLVNDNRMFGAEVFSINNGAKCQCLSLMKRKPRPFRFTWEVEIFSIPLNKIYYSSVFRSRGYDWKLAFYPKGNATDRGGSLSLFLHLDDSETLLPEGKDVVVEFKLRIVDQLEGCHKEVEATHTFNLAGTSWEWNDSLSFEDLTKSAGYLVDYTCIIEADIVVLGSANMLEFVT